MIYLSIISVLNLTKYVKLSQIFLDKNIFCLFYNAFIRSCRFFLYFWGWLSGFIIYFKLSFKFTYNIIASKQNIYICCCFLGLPLPGRENGINDYFHCNINERKLHEFPGFNAPCPPDVIDVWFFFLLVKLFILLMFW